MTDTNALISGIIYPRYSFEILNHVFNQEVSLFLSEGIIKETKRNIEKKFPDYLSGLEKLLTNCPFELVSSPEKADVIKHKGLIRDESDIPILLAAINAKVDFLVTGDKDFIGDSEVVKKLKRYFTPLPPAIFLREVMNWSDEDLEKIRLRKW